VFHFFCLSGCISLLISQLGYGRKSERFRDFEPADPSTIKIFLLSWGHGLAGSPGRAD
jgi:hypothetical protein